MKILSHAIAKKEKEKKRLVSCIGLKKEDAFPILNGSRLSVWWDLFVKARLNRHEIVLDVLWRDFETINFYFKLNLNVNRTEDCDDDIELRVLG